MSLSALYLTISMATVPYGASNALERVRQLHQVKPSFAREILISRSDMFLNWIEAGVRVAAEELPVSGLSSQSPTEANTIPTDLSRRTLTPEATKRRSRALYSAMHWSTDRRRLVSASQDGKLGFA